MANPIREIGRMTTKSKQIDGMGFGGNAPDVNEVAGALGMKHPDTGKKLIRPAYYLARLLYADDPSSRVHVKASLLNVMSNASINITDITLNRLINCAIKEMQTPIMRLNRKTGVQELKPWSKSEICRRLDIKGNKLPAPISEAYNKIMAVVLTWNSDALSHVAAALREDEAA
jgi:hypothetical protein